MKVCIPYFKDIYKDLCSRSDDKNKGINKISMLDYCQLPGLLAERLFAVLDTDGDGYLNSKEFLTGLLRFYCSTFDQKIKLVFEIYDFDKDKFITQTDITTLINCMPVVRLAQIKGEGKFTQDGGGATTFEERVESLEEMHNILDACFEEKSQIDLDDFTNITETMTSDMVLAVLSLFREKLPCSENYWRYKRNYELHMKILQGEQRSSSPLPGDSLSKLASQMSDGEECKSDGGTVSKKIVA